MDGEKIPSIYDYLAASMLAIFIVWLWAQTAIQFPEFFREAPTSLVTAASYAFYTFGGMVISYIVLEKNRSRRLSAGLKVGGFCFIAATVYFYLRSWVLQANFVVALLFSFLVGGYLGAVVYIKRTMGRVEAPPAEAAEERPPASGDRPAEAEEAP